MIRTIDAYSSIIKMTIASIKIKSRFALLLFGIVCLNSYCLFSQEQAGALQGVVMDIQTGRHLKDVIVKVQQTSAVAITNIFG